MNVGKLEKLFYLSCTEVVMRWQGQDWVRQKGDYAGTCIWLGFQTLACFKASATFISVRAYAATATTTVGIRDRLTTHLSPDDKLSTDKHVWYLLRGGATHTVHALCNLWEAYEARTCWRHQHDDDLPQMPLPAAQHPRKFRAFASRVGWEF